MFGHRDGIVEQRLADVIAKLHDIMNTLTPENIPLSKDLIQNQITKLTKLKELSGRIHDLVHEIDKKG